MHSGLLARVYTKHSKALLHSARTQSPRQECGLLWFCVRTGKLCDIIQSYSCQTGARKKSQREEAVALSVLRLLQLSQLADETNCSINEHAAFHKSRSDYQAAHQDVARLYSVLAIC